MKLRTAIAIVSVGSVLTVQSSAIAGRSAGADQTANIARTVAVGQRSTLPAGTGFERLGGLTDDELKAWAARHLTAPSRDPYLHSLVECTSTAAESRPDSRLDCDTILPNNEADIEVDPLHPRHMVASTASRARPSSATTTGSPTALTGRRTSSGPTCGRSIEATTRAGTCSSSSIDRSPRGAASARR